MWQLERYFDLPGANCLPGDSISMKWLLIKTWIIPITFGMLKNIDTQKVNYESLDFGTAFTLFNFSFRPEGERTTINETWNDPNRKNATDILAKVFWASEKNVLANGHSSESHVLVRSHRLAVFEQGHRLLVPERH